jgi:non-ribosomal peptide synthetase-like protein
MNQKSILIGLERPDLLHDETLADIFRESAKKYPDKVALIFENNSLTYSQLDNWSDAIAAYLVEEGMHPGSKVGIWWRRGLELHAAIIGIVKAGATYLPFDREMPAERVETVLNEVQADACFSRVKINVECPTLLIPPMPSAGQEIKKVVGPSPDNCAYIIFTSGSTGKPKGIPIGHRQICHLIRSEQVVIQIRPEDRVYQGFSISFDMWCEETWISYFAGATIWVADNTTSKAIDELSEVLRDQRITILHAVPSLLAVIEDIIPTLRFVNAGGEACTAQVVAKWAKPGRIFYNSYGPTETTVTATMTPLKPGEQITIGAPLPNYNLAVVDEHFNAVPRGEKGELVISGPGLSSGYVNLPQLTHEKFVAKPASLSELPGDRIYRTGDAVIMLPDGGIDFQGRLDDQVKLRGYRIELGEIENRLAGLAGVSAAAVALKKDGNDQDQLVGYVIPTDAVCVDENMLRMELGNVLPPYMIPATIVALKEMPRMPSGKINRKALPVPASLTESAHNAEEEALNLNAPLSARMLAVLHKTFPGRAIDLSMDFFTDLGGHSLLAAAFTSRLRREGGVPQASLKDVYTNRPLAELAKVWDKTPEITPKQDHTFHKVPQGRYIACWTAQTIALFFIYGLFAIQIFIPFLGYYYVKEATDSFVEGIVALIVLFCLLPPFFTAVTILVKWLVIGKIREGDYPLWGTYYFRWWFVKNVQSLLPAQFMNGTPLYPVYLRMLGVKVAPDAQLSSLSIGAEDLVTIGSDVSMSSATMLDNAVVEDGLLKFRRIHIGDHAYIGSSAVIAGGATIEDWGELQDLSYLRPGAKIGTGEVWQGSPAQLKAKKSPEELPQPLQISKSTRSFYSFIFVITLVIFPFFILLPLLPVIVILHNLDNAAPDYDFSYIVVVPALAAMYIMLFALETIVATRILQIGIKPGRYSLYSPFYVRKWLADQLMSLSLIVMHPIYATVYVSGFFRALGAKIGKKTEISTASSVTHPLLEIGSGAFVADAVTLGEADVRGQQLILDKTSIADTSFVGNSALIPQGYHLPGNMLIGVLSTPPSKEQLASNHAKDWFGSPAIALPARQPSNPFPKELTSDPSIARKLARSIVEFIRIIIPETVIISCSIFFIAYAHDLLVDSPLWQVLLLLPFYYLGFIGVPAFLVTVIMKWLLIGKYKAEQKPMWTWKVWRSEAVTTTYEALAVPFLLEYLKGTPWLPLILRLLGVKTCKRVFMNTTDITEYDMVSIGDDAAMNEECGPQTHLFEDRVMKVGPVKIGARSTIGARSIILYDTHVGNDTKLEALSLVMKGEVLSTGTDWVGSPIRPA